MITLNVIFQYKDGTSASSGYVSNSLDYPILITKPKTIEFYGGVKFEFLEESYNLITSSLTLYYGEI